ncbi:hypothetical protein B9479_001125 [Cryptococcus floricola]|uniref:GINS subunit domain-containing protein n=1 Tax=Cryptococcus floricola TaxID=2591691 RepID=A0A5D3B4Z0_9TREE|nr:hypothetical protein B9479_001125 [Cryptococcus floricola]
MSFFDDDDTSPPAISRHASASSSRPASTASPLAAGQRARSTSTFNTDAASSNNERTLRESSFDEEEFYKEIGITSGMPDSPGSEKGSNIFTPSAGRRYALSSPGGTPRRARDGTIAHDLGYQPQGGVDWAAIDEETDIEDMDLVRKIGVVWTRERGTGDIIPWEGELVNDLMDRLEQQQKMYTALRSDPQTSEEEHFKLVLVQTEVERVKYLVRSYVRTRLHKIEKFAQHIAISPEIHHLLSPIELSHAERYTELLHTHFQHSVLDSLPESFRRLDENFPDGTSMITKPNTETPVMVYIRKDCGEVALESGDQALLSKGTTHIVKQNLVDRWISLGYAEVL